MKELESFLNKLNEIQKKNCDNLMLLNENVAKFILNDSTNTDNTDDCGRGWNIVKSIYENKVKVNEVFGEKLINLLINTCAQLIINLSEESKYGLDKNQDFIKKNINLYLNLFDDIDDENEQEEATEKDLLVENLIQQDESEPIFKYSLKFFDNQYNGNLFELIIICLKLYIKFNDGTNNSILNDNNNLNETTH